MFQERVSDNQPIPGISDHLSDHSHSTATSRYTHSQPHSQTTSSYVGPSVISNGLHQEHGPGMSDHHSDSHSVHSAVSSRHSQSLQPSSTQATSLPHVGPSSYGRSPPTNNGLYRPPGQILQQRPPPLYTGGGSVDGSEGRGTSQQSSSSSGSSSGGSGRVYGRQWGGSQGSNHSGNNSSNYNNNKVLPHQNDGPHSTTTHSTHSSQSSHYNPLQPFAAALPYSPELRWDRVRDAVHSGNYINREIETKSNVADEGRSVPSTLSSSNQHW